MASNIKKGFSRIQKIDDENKVGYNKERAYLLIIHKEKVSKRIYSVTIKWME